MPVSARLAYLNIKEQSLSDHNTNKSSINQSNVNNIVFKLNEVKYDKAIISLKLVIKQCTWFICYAPPPPPPPHTHTHTFPSHIIMRSTRNGVLWKDTFSVVFWTWSGIGGVCCVQRVNSKRHGQMFKKEGGKGDLFLSFWEIIPEQLRLKSFEIREFCKVCKVGGHRNWCS